MQKENNSYMKINVSDLSLNAESVEAGQKIFLSGTVYTARDAAHARLLNMLDKGQELPFELPGAAIYYCGPSPARPGNVIGACGPTTSARMDIFTPRMLEQGVKILIGKGARADYVVESIVKNRAVYLIATGGVAALLSKTVVSSELIAFEDLGPEAVYKLEVKDMPLIAAVDCKGGNLFKKDIQ